MPNNAGIPLKNCNKNKAITYISMLFSFLQRMLSIKRSVLYTILNKPTDFNSFGAALETDVTEFRPKKKKKVKTIILMIKTVIAMNVVY